MDWLLRLGDPLCPPAERHAFDAWLKLSTFHRDAWNRACRTWEVMGETVPVNAPAWQEPQPVRTYPSRRSARRWVISTGATALAASLMAFVFLPSLIIRYQSDYRTGTSETREINLSDGSIVSLGAESALAIDYSGSERRVRLLSGEAYFEVKRDVDRPFVVDAGGDMKVKVTGTSFDVNLTPQTASVQLAEGSVDMVSIRTGGAMRLRPGDAVSVDRDNGEISRSSVDIDAIASWRGGKLFVQDVPIRAVVAEIQRYHPSWITLASGELGEHRITGLYDLSNPDRALEALVSPYGAKVHHVSPYLRVLSFF